MTPRKRNELSANDQRYLRQLKVLLKGTGKSIYDKDVQIDHHYTIYNSDTDGGREKGDVHAYHPSLWYARVTQKLARQFGYDLIVVREADYDKWRDEREKQRTQGAGKKATRRGLGNTSERKA